MGALSKKKKKKLSARFCILKNQDRTRLGISSLRYTRVLLRFQPTVQTGEQSGYPILSPRSNYISICLAWLDIYTIMKLELQSASNFLVHLVKLSSRISVAEEKLVKFRDSLVEVLRRRYRDHWFPEKPFKGPGYRCIRINGRMDPVIAQ